MISSFRSSVFLLRLSARLAKRTIRQNLCGSVIPLGIIIELTSACNLNCKACYIPKREPVRTISSETLSNLLSEASSIGIPHVSFSGGEPLTEFKNILDSLRKYPHISFSIVTNGTLITRETIIALSVFPNIQLILSTDGLIASTLFRSKESTQHFLESVALLKGSGIRYGASVRVYQENIDEITASDLHSFLSDKGFSFASFSPLLPYAASTGHLTPLSANARKKFEQFCISSRGNTFLDILSPCLDTAPCAGGGRILSVTPEGWILPCPHIPWKCHRFPENSLQEALESRFFTDFRTPAGRESTSPCFVLDDENILQTIVMRNKASAIGHRR